MELRGTYTVKQAAELGSLTIDMVNYLCRSEILEPSSGHNPGRGRARQYTFGDVVMLRAISKLLATGVSVAKLKTALRTIRKYHKKITPYSLPAKYIVTDGENIYLRQENERLTVLDDKGQMTFAFVLELNALSEEVKVQFKTAS